MASTLFLRCPGLAVMLFAACMGCPAQQTPAEAARSQTGLHGVSDAGLLPVYGIDLRVEKSWLDGQVAPQPAGSGGSGASAAMQQTWDSLKTTGFNILRIDVDAGDVQGSVTRVANLCSWAANNNVKLVLVLRATLSSSGADYPTKIATFVQALTVQFRNSAHPESYFQIAAYQLGDELNHRGLHGSVAPDALRQMALDAASRVRATEREAWAEMGRPPTPIMISASFDYELVQARLIAGAPWNDEAYQQAYATLIGFLQPIAAFQDVDLISVSWSPGSITAGDVERPPLLLRSLTGDLGDKQIVFTTGFSTAFHSVEEQKGYYARAFANLSELRASGGTASNFIGMIFREALNGRSPPAVTGISERMATWDWPTKSDELAAMWNGTAKSQDMAWWWQKVRNNMGLLNTTGGAQQALRQINDAMREQGVAPAGSAALGFKQALKAKTQQATMDLLDKVFQRLDQTVSGFRNRSAGSAANSDPRSSTYQQGQPDPNAGNPVPSQTQDAQGNATPSDSKRGNSGAPTNRSAGQPSTGANATGRPNGGSAPRPYSPTGASSGPASANGAPAVRPQLPPGSRLPVAGGNSVRPVTTAQPPKTMAYAGNTNQPPGNMSPVRGTRSSGMSAPNGAASNRQQGNSQPQQALRPDVSVNTREISYGPMPLRSGQKVTFRVNVRNLGKGAAPRVLLALSLRGGTTVVNGPLIQFALSPGGSHQAVWETSMPAGQQVQLTASVSAAGDSNLANNRAVIVLPASVGVGARAQSTNRGTPRQPARR